jgi:hypothetical protein
MAQTAQSRVLSKDEMRQLYENEWVLFEITRLTRTGKSWGRVLVHSPNRVDLSATRIRFHEEHPEGKTGVFFAGPLVDPEFEGAILL